MFKSLLLSFTCVAALTMVSCQKQYTCECVHELYEGPGELTNTSTDIKLIKSNSESSAAKSCVSNNSSQLDAAGYGHVTLCNLK
jgi:hypothetical protein